MNMNTMAVVISFARSCLFAKVGVPILFRHNLIETKKCFKIRRSCYFEALFWCGIIVLVVVVSVSCCDCVCCLCPA